MKNVRIYIKVPASELDVKKNSLNGRRNVKVGSSRQGKDTGVDRGKDLTSSWEKAQHKATSGTDMERTMSTADTVRLMVTQQHLKRAAVLPQKANPSSQGSRETASATVQQAIITLEPLYWINFKLTWTTGGRQRHVAGPPALATGSGCWIRETRYGGRHRRKTNGAFTNRIVGTVSGAQVQERKIC
jgi:hypothetical protein